MATKSYQFQNQKWILSTFIWVLSIFCLSQFSYGQSVTFEWDANNESDLAGYNVYRSETPGTGHYRLNTSLVLNETYEDDTIPPGVTCYYVVTAVNDTGLESGFSNEIATTTDPASQPQPFEQLIEAEDFQIVSPNVFDVVAELDVFGGQTLAVRSDVVVAGTNPPTDAVFPIVLPSDQQYSFWVRLYGPSTSEDSVWIGFDDQQQVVHIGVWNEWIWRKGYDLDLLGGSHELRLGHRERNTRIDAIYINSDPNATPPEPETSPPPPNSPPVAQNDAFSTDEDQVVTVSPLSNDQDPDGHSLSISSYTQPQAGQVTAVGATQLSYNPPANFFGSVEFNYTATDSLGGSDQALIAISVQSANDPPVAHDDSAETTSDQAVRIEVLANDEDVDGDTLSVSEFSQGQNGSVTLNADQSLQYTPNVGSSGSDCFSYTASDNLASDQANVCLDVLSVNQNPEANDDIASTPEDTPVLISVLDNDFDGDGDPLVIVSLSRPVSGSASIVNDSSVNYIPNPNFNGIDRLTYTVSDRNGGSASAQINIQVTPVNDAPEADAGPDQFAQPGSSLTLQGAASDVDGDPVSVEWVQVQGPEITIENPRSLHPKIYLPITAKKRDKIILTLSVSDGQTQVEDTCRILMKKRKGRPHRLVAPTQKTNGEDLFLGVAVYNPKETEEDVLLFELDSQGNVLQSGVVEDSVSPGGQRAFVAGQFLEPNGEATALVVEGFEGDIQGFFMRGDTKLTKLDGVSSSGQQSNHFFFPMVRTGGEKWTELFIFNSSEDTAEDVTLELFDKSGHLISEAQFELEVEGSINGPVSQIFEVESLADGYVEVTSSIGLEGLAFINQNDALSATTTLEANTSKHLYSPHFYMDSLGSRTDLHLLNLNEERVFVLVTAFDEQGAALASVDFPISSRQLFVADLGTLLGLGSALEQQGSLKGTFEVQIFKTGFDNQGMLGLVSFLGPNGRSFSTLPMESTGQTETLFLHVAQSMEMHLFTGLALFNPGSEDSDLLIQAVDKEGQLTAEATLSVPARQRVLGLLNSASFFGADFNQVGGYLRMTATNPIISFALFGDYQGEFLSAIQAAVPNMVELEP